MDHKLNLIQKSINFDYWGDIEWPHAHNSTDPNEIYRPWLEKNVGKQYFEWDWDLVNSKIRVCFKDEQNLVWFLLIRESLLKNGY